MGIAKPSSTTTAVATTQAIVRPRRVNATAAEVSAPPVLSRILHEMQNASGDAIASIASCPLLSGCRVTGVSFGLGATVTIAHSLGRAYVGWWCVRAQGAPWSGYEAALPAGSSASKVIALTSVNGGQYDFWIF